MYILAVPTAEGPFVRLQQVTHGSFHTTFKGWQGKSALPTVRCKGNSIQEENLVHIKAKLGMAVIACLVAAIGPTISASAAPQQTQSGWGFVRNLQTNRCLEERPGNVISTGGVPCRGDNDQTWTWVPNGGGWASLVNRSTGNCLDASSGRVYSLTCSDKASQLWRLFPDGKIQQWGSFAFLDDYYGSTRLLPDNNNAYQRWY
ncbi:RICIN domain-containing protein [Kribbella sp. NPDC055071]